MDARRGSKVARPDPAQSLGTGRATARLRRPRCSPGFYGVKNGHSQQRPQPSLRAARRSLLEQVLAHVDSPLQPALLTRDSDEAQLWHDLLPEAAGTEGLVIKRLTQSYPRREQHIWPKLRHTETSDVAVVGFTGRPDRPVVTASLSTALRQQLAPVLPALAEPAQTRIGETQYTRVRPGLVAEVEEGTTRHCRHPAGGPAARGRLTSQTTNSVPRSGTEPSPLKHVGRG
ncbi:hypothetical protein [Streptomyces sp. 8N706]|uniref:hypothetical protein n=1 Tax=Streptomyces sp. 8N706 TaxID=3457416 RepID=UPI003FD3F6E9